MALGLGLLLASAWATPASAHNSAPPDGPRTFATDDAPACTPRGGPAVLDGTIAPEDESSYRLLPVGVSVGTTRVELHYTYGDVGSSPVPNSGTDSSTRSWPRSTTPRWSTAERTTRRP